MTSTLRLDKEYQLTRAALVNGGVDMTDSMDALYREWRRWRGRLESRARGDSAAVGKADQWWSDHLAQFRCLIDPRHVAARTERARKDQASSSRKTIS
jgi:hypothetical protein